MSEGWGQPPGGQPPYPQQPPQHFGPQQYPPQQYPPQDGGFGPVPYPVQQSAGSLAIVALVLAIGSWVFGGILFSIPAVILAKVELGKIDRGESPEAGRQFAQIGWWAGIANVVFTVVVLAGVCVFYAVIIGVVAGAGAAGR